MRIGGIQKFSLIDYPAKGSCVLFTQGCPFRCPFCHNPALVIPSTFSAPIAQEEVFSFLEKRKDKLDAVVISGGEPTMHRDLLPLMRRIKEMGFLIKLDTNGIHPSVLQKILTDALVDYVAMDIKGPLEKYHQMVQTPIDQQKIQKSIDLLMTSSIPFEFRSTIVPTLHSAQDIENMVRLIKNAPLYILQKFQPRSVLIPSFQKITPFSDQAMEKFREIAAPYVQQCEIR